MNLRVSVKPFLRFLLAPFAVAVAFGLRILLVPVTGTGAPFVLFFGAVLVTSLYAGLGPGLLTVILSAPLAAYVFVVGAGYPIPQALAQALLFSLEGLVVVYLAFAVRRATRRSQEAELRFRLALDEAPNGMALIELDGRFARVNRALCEILGYTDDELAALSFPKVTHPADRETDRALAQRLVAGEIRRYKHSKRLVKKDGTSVDVMLSAALLRSPERVPLHYVAQIEDVTERNRLEEQLRLSEAKSSGILAISADPIISIDEEQRITLFNDAAERVFGYGRPDVVGSPLDALIPERFRSAHREHVKRFAAGENRAGRMGERGSPIFGLRKSGEEFPADAAISKFEVGGKKILTVSLRDVTDERRLEKEQGVLAAVGPTIAATLDVDEALVRIARLAAQTIADLCLVDVVGEDHELRRIAVASRDPSKAWLCDRLRNLALDRTHPHLVSAVFESGEPLLLQRPTREHLGSLAQSEEHLDALVSADIQSMAAVPLVAHEHVLGALAFISSTPALVYGAPDVRFFQHIAERAALSIENALLYREAQRATHARDDVLAIVAHDLRNPLSSILMQTNRLRRHGPAGERRTQTPVETIERAGQRMNRLIQDLLDVARMEAGGLPIDESRVGARQLVLDAVEAQEALAASASVALRVDVADDLPDLCGDRDRLLQVFENLIGNALKFTSSGGRITVTAVPEDSQVLFSVSDTGAGIAVDDLPHVFDRFWQTARRDRRGAGLGLPIAKGVVEAHHGRIWVESALGNGTTFFFTVPCFDGAYRAFEAALAAP